MATTSPDGLISPDASDPYDLTSDMAAMQASTQAALVNRASKTGTNTQMLGASGVQTGTLWFNTTHQRLYRYNGTGWDGVTPAPVEESETDLRGTLNSGFTATTLAARRYGNTVEIYGAISGTFTSRTNTATDLTSAIPPALRPDHSVLGPGYLFVSGGGGFGQGVVHLRSSGSLRLFYLSGTDRTSVTFSMTYVLS